MPSGEKEVGVCGARRSALATNANGRRKKRLAEEERETVLLGISQIDGSIPEEE